MKEGFTSFMPNLHDLSQTQKQHWADRLTAIVSENPKKMNRYKEKISKIIFSALKDTLSFYIDSVPYEVCKDFEKSLKEDMLEREKCTVRLMSMRCATLQDFCTKYTHQQLGCNGVPASMIDPHFISRSIPTFFISDSLQIINSDIEDFSSFLKGSEIILSGESITFAGLFDKALGFACENYLIKKLITDDNVTEENFMSRLPSCDSAEAQALMYDILSVLLPCLISETYAMFSRREEASNTSESELTKENKKEQNELKKQASALERRVKEKEKVIQAKNEKIQTLSKKLTDANKSVEKTVKKRTEAIANENKELLRQNQKLQSYYSDLRSKYEKLKAEVNGPEDDVKEDKKETMKEVDVNARYLFLLFDHIGCRQNIKDAFPNAEFTSKASSLFLQKYDMVVALTECIDHSNYLAMKKQCKICNVPFAHSPYSNIDMIKTVIWNALNG